HVLGPVQSPGRGSRLGVARRHRRCPVLVSTDRSNRVIRTVRAFGPHGSYVGGLRRIYNPRGRVPNRCLASLKPMLTSIDLSPVVSCCQQYLTRLVTTP